MSILKLTCPLNWPKIFQFSHSARVIFGSFQISIFFLWNCVVYFLLFVCLFVLCLVGFIDYYFSCGVWWWWWRWWWWFLKDGFLFKKKKKIMENLLWSWCLFFFSSTSCFTANYYWVLTFLLLLMSSQEGISWYLQRTVTTILWGTYKYECICICVCVYYYSCKSPLWL